ncbi:MFS transporter [Paenibacillus sp. HJL G12]|uniref:MFS transporter n=1 Tax=Paenibacillus dendrobii TaxID=2691084 RepID=A0A7X3LH18_9BACL|nr:MFS transporter [Paenibacillus dendrobii]MWV42739.1 MFS transporter [Paenibacillus dendrobii]
MLEGKIWTKNFVIVCLSSFFMFLTFYVTATAFPLYVGDQLSGNAQQMGLVITIYVIGGVLIRPLSGLWVDRFGMKKMALIGLVIFLLACMSYFGANGITIFLMIRFLHGMSYAIASTATSTIASSMIPGARKGEGMGYYSMFMSIAMVIGPAFGLLLWQDKNRTLLLSAIALIAFLSLLFALPINDREPSVKPTQAAAKSRFSLREIFELKALPISIVGFVLAFSYSPIAGFIAPFANEIHQSKVAGTFFIVFAIMIVVFRPLVGKIFDRYNEHVLFYPGFILFGLGLLLLSQSHSGAMVLLSGAFMGIGYGALFPCIQALAMKLSPIHRTGAANGTFFLLFDLGYGVGSYVMGFISSHSNYRTMFAAAGIVALASIIVYYFIHHKRHTVVKTLNNTSTEVVKH